MIRTQIIPCNLNKELADSLNLASGQIYTGVLVRHYRVLRKKGIWLSEKSGTKLSDYNTEAKLHAHSIDAAQQGFYKACKTAKAVKRIDSNAKYPHWTKRYRTTIWKNTAIKRKDNRLVLSTGLNNQKITIIIPESMLTCLRFVEIRLVFDKRSLKYDWHIVAETGKQPRIALGNNIISVDLGEIHPAVVGDEDESTIITCRARRHEQQGHTKRLASLQEKIARTKNGSRKHKKLMRTKSKMKTKHNRVLRDMSHKISRGIVNVAVERKADTIVIGDIKNIGNGINIGKKSNQKVSQWNHGKDQSYTKYKAEAEGIKIKLQNEAYTSQTCPSCGNRHKPKGRNYKCPSCGFRGHRDVVGQINILSAYKFGEPGKIPAPTKIKHSVPYDVRRTLRCMDTGQIASPLSVACR